MRRAGARLRGADATLWRVPLDVAPEPAQALLALRDDERPFALLGAWAGGGAVLGSDPVRVAGADEDLFALLDELPGIEAAERTGTVAGRPPRGARPGELTRGPIEPESGVVGGGWVGYLGFELRHAVEAGQPPPPRPVPLPAGALAYYDHVLRRDPAGRWWFEALVTPARAAAIEQRCALLAARLAAPPPARPFATRDWTWTPSLAAHAEAVEACRERIAAGDLFQASLCLRLEGRVRGDALDLFAAAAAALPTDRAAFVSGPWGALASVSPELFLSRRGRRARSAPIKGTRPAGRRAELEASAKDRAENVMIVDLVRNDLGRVCRPGGVRVPALAQARPHAGVWHLVSEVEGELRADVDDAQLLRATFPPGSVTGAPKLAALDVIAELESTGREIYTGAIGLASPLAGLELSVAIRTFEIRGERIWLGVGGGIVADSDGAAEAREARTKAAPLLAAIGAQLPDEPRSGRGHGPRGADAVRRPLRRGARPVARPDPDAGLYETILVSDGRPVRLDAHLIRLGASFRALYGRGPARELDALVRAEAAIAGAAARLRVDVTPDGEVEIVTSPLPPAGPVTLRPVTLPGGLGRHKWRDRRLLEAHEADDPGTLPLLVDCDGWVLEASRANVVVAARDGTLYTPPLDGRILPGTERARLGARERRLALADLRAAAAVFVTSALRGRAAARLG